MKMTISPPPVSIGVPVYNGENYLSECLESILAQSFGDFKVVISDNASTDGTADICEAYRQRDSRIQVIRHPMNIGAAKNFNFLFQTTTEEYFKWCAHDDILAPDYMQKTMALMKDRPEASLCHSQTVIFNDAKEELGVFAPNFHMPANDPVARLREIILRGQRCYEVFGIFRRRMLENTDLIGNYRGGDNVLLFRLALLGPFAIVDEPLFYLRRHEKQSTMLVQDSQAYHQWFTGERAKLTFPDWRFLRETWRAPAGLSLGFSDRMRCASVLLAETYRRRSRLRQNLRVAAETLVFGSSDPQRRRRLFG